MCLKTNCSFAIFTATFTHPGTFSIICIFIFQISLDFSSTFNNFVVKISFNYKYLDQEQIQLTEMTIHNCPIRQSLRLSKWYPLDMFLYLIFTCAHQP